MWQLWGRCKWTQFTQQVGMHHVSFLSCTHKMLPCRSIFSLLLSFANFCFCLHSSLLAVHLMHINVCPSFWWDQGKDIRGRLFLHFRHFWDSGESRFFGIKEHPSGINGKIFFLLPKRWVGNRFSSNQQRGGWELLFLRLLFKVSGTDKWTMNCFYKIPRLFQPFACSIMCIFEGEVNGRQVPLIIYSA